MNALRKLPFLAAILLLLAGCVEQGAGRVGGGLATRANLSPEAIRLQSQTETLLTLQQEQNAAKRRQQNFMIQAGLIGGVVGAGAGALVCKIRDCSDQQRRTAIIGGAVAGGAVGAKAGAEQAKRQNAAAKAENELKRRIQIAGKQLTSTREASNRARNIANFHARKLADLRRKAAAGNAQAREQLVVARADAKADARAVQASVSAMQRTEKSLSQGEKPNSTLKTRERQVESALKSAESSLGALQTSISRSAL